MNLWRVDTNFKLVCKSCHTNRLSLLSQLCYQLGTSLLTICGQKTQAAHHSSGQSKPEHLLDILSVRWGVISGVRQNTNKSDSCAPTERPARNPDDFYCIVVNLRICLIKVLVHDSLKDISITASLNILTLLWVGQCFTYTQPLHGKCWWPREKIFSETELNECECFPLFH